MIRRRARRGGSKLGRVVGVAIDLVGIEGLLAFLEFEAPRAGVLARFAAAIRLGSPDSGDMGLALGVVRTLSRIDSALAASPR